VAIASRAADGEGSAAAVTGPTAAGESTAAGGRDETAQSRTLERLLSLPLEVTVILGSGRRSLRELMYTAPGSIIPLDQLYGAPLEVSVNGRPVATGELTVVGDHFAVRLLKLVSPAARARGLGRAGS